MGLCTMDWRLALRVVSRSPSHIILSPSVLYADYFLYRFVKKGHVSRPVVRHDMYHVATRRPIFAASYEGLEDIKRDSFASSTKPRDCTCS